MLEEEFYPNAPFEYICPITQFIMSDPVTTADGHTFQRTAIEKWFQTGHYTNPLTNQPLESTKLVPNRALKNLIKECTSEAAGIKVEKKQNINLGKFALYINKQLKQKFPQLIDDFGIVNVEKLAKMKQKYKKHKQENSQLRSLIDHWRSQFQYHLPNFYEDGQVNYVGLAKSVKNELRSNQRIKELMKTIDELREELFILEQQKKLAIDLMNSSFQPVKMKTVNITEPWYDQAAKAIDEIMVPVSSLVVHITESNT